MDNIVDIKGRQILDSRGNPTVEVDVTLADGSYGSAGVPSGASTGAHEAWEMRDGDKSYYMGKGVLKAIENINGPLAEALHGLPATDQALIDQAMIDLQMVPKTNRTWGPTRYWVFHSQPPKQQRCIPINLSTATLAEPARLCFQPR